MSAPSERLSRDAERAADRLRVVNVQADLDCPPGDVPRDAPAGVQRLGEAQREKDADKGAPPPERGVDETVDSPQ